jgi:hypothetical protein
MAKTKNRAPVSPSAAPARLTGTSSASITNSAPSAHEYSISDVSLEQDGAPVGGSAGSGSPITISGIASPAANAATVQVIIYYYKDGELVQYSTPITVTFDVNTGEWSAVIPAAVLQELAGLDVIFEIIANGPDPSMNPTTDRPVHIN